MSKFNTTDKDELDTKEIREEIESGMLDVDSAADIIFDCCDALDSAKARIKELESAEGRNEYVSGLKQKIKAREDRIVELELSLNNAVNGLHQVVSVAHMCNDCCSYEAAHSCLIENNGFQSPPTESKEGGV
jgi:chromosome segregation ATPase